MPKFPSDIRRAVSVTVILRNTCSRPAAGQPSRSFDVDRALALPVMDYDVASAA
ncbi:hypothetical protein [Roseiconus lacunae]|uniref:hypothetical protein n=1 Tax=Roseiconus lacunae TaxID=2605694 RepID=UPI001E3A436D|nr:hypothetical protein [Roseiconus lacunae]